MASIFLCKTCGKYTMKKECCGQKTLDPKPIKYSPEDKYGEYRRQAKRAELESEGLI